MEVKIRSYRLTQRGDRGLAVTIPKEWAEQNNVPPGTRLDFYQNEHGDLIIRPRKETCVNM